MTHTLSEQMRAYMAANQLLTAHDRLLVAVSGGADSVVLAHLFKQLGHTFAIAHVNFMLREEESEGDALFVKQLAAEWQIPFFTIAVDAHAYAHQHKLNTQLAAREIRYDFFQRLCESEGFTKVAVAHHANDQAETFFINLYRRAGLRGLAGIPVKNENIIRPLLFASRSEIEDYARINQLHFRTDSSNLTDNYLRNKIRHHLLPKAREIMPGFVSGLLQSMNHLSETDDLIRSLVQRKKEEIFFVSNDQVVIPVSGLLALKPTSTWLFYLLYDFGFHREQLKSLAEAIGKGQVGKVFVSGRYALLIDRDQVIISEIGQSESVAPSTLYPENESVCNRVRLTMEVIPADQLSTWKTTPDQALFDFDKLEFPLTLRPWRHGDRLVPLGMNGSKLVSDVLIDNKISRWDKEQVMVLTQQETVLWIIGCRASNHAMLTPLTKRVYRISHLGSCNI
ncbi:MAG: tRNA lysidine(34) synthetase TilS [Bacteroidales bacterium]|nr:tRNA lysidine(34) synthetase TilS [Bacteroidales bacterium]